MTAFTGMIDYIPGLPPMQPEDLPSDIQSGDPSNIIHQLVVQQLPALKEATWIISNTVYELESQASDALKELSPLFGSIGPLIPSIYLEGEGKPQDFSIVSPRSLSLWAESNCLPWLDSKPERSVLYVSFGSLAQISKVQVHEIAIGLMESEQVFSSLYKEQRQYSQNIFLIFTVTNILASCLTGISMGKPSRLGELRGRNNNINNRL